MARPQPSSAALSTARRWDTRSSAITSGRSTTRCSTRPVLVIRTSITRVSASGTISTWRTVERVREGYWTTATVPGQLREQPDGPGDDLVEVERAGQEGLDGPPFGPGQGLDLGQPVDEQPVALVGRDPPRAGVGLVDVAPSSRARHVVADGRPARRRGCAGRPSALEPTGSWVET